MWTTRWSTGFRLPGAREDDRPPVDYTGRRRDGDGVRRSDGRAVEPLERPARGRAALALVARAVLLRAVRVLARRGEPEEAELADLHARVELDRQRRDVGELEGHVPGEAGVDEAGGRVREQAQPAELRLALHACGDVVGQRHHLVGRPEDELARVQDERLVTLRLDLAGQLGLVGGRVDVGVAMVLEDPEEPVEPDVDAGRLQHLRVPRIERDPAGVDLSGDVAVREQHAANLAADPPRWSRWQRQR